MPDMSDEVDQTIPALASSLGIVDAATGKLSDLATVDKSSLVAAISESSNGLDALKADVANKSYYVTPEMYGAVGNGTTDDGTAFLNMYADAKTKQVSVRLTKSRYKITKPLNTVGVSTYSDIYSVLDIQVSAADGNAFTWGGENVTICGVCFELSNSTTNTSMQGLYNASSNVNNQRFIRNKVKGKTFKSDGVTGNIYGVWVNANGLRGVRICDNVFETVNYPVQINQQTAGGNIATPMGSPIENIYIEDNVILKGTIGINTPHVYCHHAFIRNNRVTSDTGFNINLAHVNNFVVEGNILDGATVTTDSVLHIEDVSYAGTVTNNIIRAQNQADAIRIQLASGVSQDTYVPTEGILVEGNDLKGVGNANGVQIVDTSSKRIKLSNNRIENFAIGATINATQCDINDNRFLSCPLCLYLTQRVRVSGLIVESCTTIVRSGNSIPVEIDGITFIGEVPTLKPQVVSSNISMVIYRNVRFSSPVGVTISSTTAFDLFVLPDSGKFDFNLYYKLSNTTNSSIVRLNAKYDGTTFTPTKTYELLNGGVGGGTFAMTAGKLTASHFLSGGTLSITWDITIDSLVYTA
ncbi:hypothetical protein [Paenibacillus pectinilyticus]|nr:hypothetical protein [Paenibacillus pectinilyticus]